MTRLGIIGGSGLTELNGLEITRRQKHQTPYGSPSSQLTFGKLAGKEVLFLPRHGSPHVIPPHLVNYRANIRALKDNGIDCVIAVNAVGGITDDMPPGRLVIPDQIIDYTHGRSHTYFEENIDYVMHVDFTSPYSESLRQSLISAARTAGLKLTSGGTYGATQGPRLETAVEIRRMEQDGCDLVGMTGMPEAALARELELEYASVCVVANRAAGKSGEVITMENIEKCLRQGMKDVHRLLEAVIPLLD